MLFPTTIVGSFPQPEWLIDRAKLAGRFPPRVRAKELWRIPAEHLAEAQDDATLIAIRAQEEAGPRHRQRRRDPPRELLEPLRDRARRRRPRQPRHARSTAPGHPNPVPRIVGRIRRRHAVEVDDLKFLRAHTDRMVKITVPGPFTMLQQAQNDFYAERGRGGDGLRRRRQRGDPRPVRRRRRRRADRRALHAGAAREGARCTGCKALNRALEGMTGDHGRAHLLRLRGDHPRAAERLLVPARAGAVQLPSGLARDGAVEARLLGAGGARGQADHGRLHRSLRPEVETPETVVARIERALPYVKAENVILAPDCGMKYLPRDRAVAKLKAMVEGAKILRRRHGGRN